MITPGPTNQRIRFGEFEAHLNSGEVFRSGQRLQLQSKPFLVLEALLRAQGEVVRREQIVQTVWPNVHVGRLSLNTAVRKLRAALHDDATHPQLIETVGSRGYRMLVPVTLPQNNGVESNHGEQFTVAVIPFQNLGHSADEFFSDGLTEQMIAQLGRSHRSLWVIAPVSAMQYKSTAKEPWQVGEELRSDFVLCGTVLRSGKCVRINAKLIRSKDSVCLWSDSYSRDLRDLLAVQDEITSNIAGAILLALPRPPHERSQVADSPAVYEKYLKACFFASKASEPGFAKAAELFQEVMEEDPNFGPAYASMAVILSAAGQYGMFPPKQIYQRVDQLFVHARKLCPDLPETHIALAHANFFYYARFDQAEAAFCEALNLNYSSAPAHLGLAMLLCASGRFEEGLRSIRRARDLDPLSLMVNAILSAALHFAGNFDEALEQANRTVEMESGFPTGHACVGSALSALGRQGDAVSAYRRAVACCPQSQLMLAHLAQGLAVAGAETEAHSLLSQIIDFRQNRGWCSSYWIGLVYAALGETDAALDWMEIAFEEGDGWRVMAAVDPRTSPIADEPRFRRLLEQQISRTPAASASSGA